MNLNILYFDIISYGIVLCVFIFFVVFTVLMYLLYFSSGTFMPKTESSLLEFLWTLLPTLSVIILCILNVYIVESEGEEKVGDSVKVVGRQWYWSYDYEGEEYDSFISNIVNNVDNPLQISYGIPTRILVTSSDVLHSFSVPDLGIKVDAIPGRINNTVIIPDRVGVFVGYCSELCGTGHSYMPIVVEVVKKY
uniref:Cytochrome c oxidase subunit 2 n=1 Tax=Tetrancistrum nebulosi TaxID=879209 RepID=I3NLR4_9PLAT|nr:cytochrome c oxidase subunit II [Tetrancistrum nebulosi]ADN44057.1 cytochrome c oxidase subunit II [Tetrancistrum nebulosi]